MFLLEERPRLTGSVLLSDPAAFPSNRGKSGQDHKCKILELSRGTVETRVSGCSVDEDRL